ncbi:MAG TPA: alpha/beta fold hydrolase [Methylocystis sp.]|nr:alpha/beta fold hydrolase [Methylocystis sp.]
MSVTPSGYLTAPRPDAGAPWRIAYRLRPAQGPGRERAGYVWLGGFASNMLGEKASFIDAKAAASQRAMLRFDYSGHGESAFDAEGARFEDGAVSDWLEQSLALFLAKTSGPQILIGSSMGAWIALLLARRLAELGEVCRLHGLLLLAPAVDFTEELLWKGLPEAARREILEKGVYMRRSVYGATPITKLLIQDGRNLLLLEGQVRAYAPTHILQGALDEDVPWTHALRLCERLYADPVTFTLVPGGDHRLSRPADLELIGATLDRFDEQSQPILKPNGG